MGSDRRQPGVTRAPHHPRPSAGQASAAKADIADYVLVYRNTKLAVIEAKAWDLAFTEGVGQAKSYAAKLAIRYTYSTNGQAIYGIDMTTGVEGDVASYPSPDELWNLTFAETNAWRDRFAAVPPRTKAAHGPTLLPGNRRQPGA